MVDIRSKLKAKYAAGNKYANFGAALRSIDIKGFRGIENITLS